MNRHKGKPAPLLVELFLPTPRGKRRKTERTKP